MQNLRVHNLKLAERGAWISILAYIALSVLQLTVATYVKSDSLRANGFNNLTDILGNVALLIGLKMARIPADQDHVYGHWKVESIASLISSFIMAVVGFEVLRETISNIIHHSQTSVDPIGAWMGAISALIMVLVYLYNNRLSQTVSSPALAAAAKDNLSDAVISLGTTIAILAAAFNWPIIDRLAALVICIFIFKTAYNIFRDSAFSLSDGFDETLLPAYQAAIEQFDQVKSVKQLRGRTYGANIFLDVVIEMSPDLSVYESHEITEDIENMLQKDFNIYDVDVHVEPYTLPDQEKEAALALLLLGLEEKLLQGEILSAPSFFEIDEQGQRSTRPTLSQVGISNYQPVRVSAKTFILSYQTRQLAISSVWRRESDWHCIFRQVTKIKKNHPKDRGTASSKKRL